MTTAAPVAGANVWQLVMDRAGHRCQCTACARHRRDADGRCEATTDVAKLTAGPATPDPDPAVNMTAPIDSLIARCAPCWDAALAAARKHRRQAAAEALRTAETLF